MKQDFLSLYDQSFDDLYRFIYCRTGNKWDADDIVSDVFRKAFEKYSTVSGSPRAWLFVIARNAVTDYYRRKKSTTVNDGLDMLLIDESIYDCDDRLEKMDTYNCLNKILSSLCEEDLEIIRLKYFSNLKYKEIGEITGKNVDSVKTKASRIVKKLRLMLIKCLEG